MPNRNQILHSATLLLLAGLFVLGFRTVTPTPVFPRPVPVSTGLDSLFIKADQLLDNGRYDDALKLVDSIYILSGNRKEQVWQVKAVFYRVYLTRIKQEDGLPKSFALLQQEMGKPHVAPVSSLLEAVYAIQLQAYVNQNLWKLQSRTPRTDEDTLPVPEWSLVKLNTEILRAWDRSMGSAKDLQQYSVRFMAPMLDSVPGSRFLRPTVYDLMASMAFEVMRNEVTWVTRPADRFYVLDPRSLSTGSQFVDMPVPSTDTLSRTWRGIRLLQQWTAFHLNDKDPSALIDVELLRLNWCRSAAVFPDRDSLWMNTLKQLEKKYITHPASGWISLQIAREYRAMAGRWQYDPDSIGKNGNVLALQVLDAAIDRHPSGPAAEYLRSLRYEIKQPRLSITYPAMVNSGQDFRFVAAYTNLAQVRYKIIALPGGPETFKSVGFASDGYYNDAQYTAILKWLNSRSPVQSGVTPLPLDENYLSHSSDIHLNPVTPGYYALLVSPEADFEGTYDRHVIITWFQASSLSLVMQKGITGVSDRCFVLNRKDGAPLVGQPVRVERQENYSNWVTVGTPVTGNDGAIKLLPEWYGKYYPWRFSAGKTPDRVQGIGYLYGSDGWGWDDDWGGDDFGSEETDPKPDPKKEPVTSYAGAIFMDRTLYRPGQTILFKVLVYTRKGYDYTLVTNDSVSLQLKDVNGREVGKTNLKTNGFGTAAGSFVIPQDVLNGTFTISVAGYNAAAYPRVEEYKRPKFYVQFDTLKDAVRLGDQVTVTGNALMYAGSKVSGANVRYRVVREAQYPWYCWRWAPQTNSTEIASGNITADPSGVFRISFPALADPSAKRKFDPTYRYTITADVTDAGGETHSGYTLVYVGTRTLDISASVSDNIMRGDSIRISLNSTNLSQYFLPSSGTLEIVRMSDAPGLRLNGLATGDLPLYGREQWFQWFPYSAYPGDPEPETELQVAYTGKFNTAVSRKLHLPTTSGWPQGNYKVKMSTKDAFGRVVRFETGFTITDPGSKEVLDMKPLELLIPEYSLTQQDTLRIIAGSAYEKAHIWVTIYKGGKSHSSGWLPAGAGRRFWSIPMDKSWCGQVNVHAWMYAQGELYSAQAGAYVSWDDPYLKSDIVTFRDKLIPGQPETWTVKLSRTDGKPVDAELVTGMYDASLDAIGPSNSWNAWIERHPSYYLNVALSNLTSGGSRYGNAAFRHWDNPFHPSSLKYEKFTVSTRKYQLDYMILQGQYSGYYGGYYRDYDFEGEDDYGSDDFGDSGGEEYDEVKSEDKPVKEKMLEAPKPSSVMNELTTGTILPDVQEQTKNNKDTPPEPVVEPDAPGVRKNLQETAFFLPQLHTGADGSVTFTFTSPEALTEWKWMGLAHTRDLLFTTFSKKVKTQKDLMVLPNMPRFFRSGDLMTLAVKVSNLSAATLSGSANIRIEDALSGKDMTAIMVRSDLSPGFAVPAGQESAVQWLLAIPQDIAALKVTVTGQCPGFSDGEQHIIPVLTNRMMVLETLPLPVRGNQTRTFDFTALRNQGPTDSRVPHRMVLEFTPNPAWNAVLALPYLMEYPHECSEQKFNRVFANSLAAHVIKQRPEIQQVFKEWEKTAPSQFMSQLEQNPELKYILLNETPWVRDAAGESQQRKNISLLFDAAKLAAANEKSVKELMKNQLPSGAFPWFTGGPPDRYITQYLVTGFGHLRHLNVDIGDERIQGSMKKAIQYLDDEMRKDYEWMKAHGLLRKDDPVGYYYIHYFYARSFWTDISMKPSVKEAYTYFYEGLDEDWTERTLYNKGLMVLIYHRNKDTDMSKKILESLRQLSLQSDEMGMYWKDLTENQGWWYDDPIQTMSLLIEAFHEADGNIATVDEMRLWLLKQKQTQYWRSTRATSEAVYALLLTGTNWTKETRMPVIELGGKQLDPEKDLATRPVPGSGYFKYTWMREQISLDMAKVKIQNTNQIAAWGALYYQYFEDLDKIPATTGKGLMLKRIILRVTNTPTGQVLEPITADKPIKRGDRLRIRMDLVADRAFEYVHLKDGRASTLEPVSTLSGYRWQGGLGYYMSIEDAATHFFLNYVPKGSYSLEYDVWATYAGTFTNGIATIQCMYAPEFTAHSGGQRLIVE